MLLDERADNLLLGSAIGGMLLHVAGEPMAGPLDHVWSAFHARLHAFVAGRVKDAADADDVLQEVFLRVHRNLDTLRSNERLGPWLFQIARHAIADHYRASATRPDKPAGLGRDMENLERERPEATSGSPPSDAESRRAHEELADCLRPLMEHLTPDYREALVATELDGMTQRAAAERLGMSVSGMKSRVQRGRRRLRSLLEDCCRIELDAGGGIQAYEPRQDSCGPCSGRDQPHARA